MRADQVRYFFVARPRCMLRVRSPRLDGAQRSGHPQLVFRGMDYESGPCRSLILPTRTSFIRPKLIKRANLALFVGQIENYLQGYVELQRFRSSSR
jgi:hypothetical protein